MDIVKCAKFVVYLALFVAFIAMSYKVGTDQNIAPIKKGGRLSIYLERLKCLMTVVKFYSGAFQT